MTTEEKPKALRGFAALLAKDPERMRAIASRGGKSVHAAGRAHVFTSEEAREAGRKGGLEAQRRKLEREADDSQPKSDASEIADA